jgi:hypothetical protein
MYLLRSALQRNSAQYANTMGSNPPILWAQNTCHISHTAVSFSSDEVGGTC